MCPDSYLGIVAKALTRHRKASLWGGWRGFKKNTLMKNNIQTFVINLHIILF